MAINEVSPGQNVAGGGTAPTVTVDFDGSGAVSLSGTPTCSTPPIANRSSVRIANVKTVFDIVEQEGGGNGSSGGPATATVDADAPLNPQQGRLWWRVQQDNGQLMVWYVQQNEQGQWVVANWFAVYVGETAPENPTQGLFWVHRDGATRTLKVYDQNDWRDLAGGSGGSGPWTQVGDDWVATGSGFFRLMGLTAVGQSGSDYTFSVYGRAYVDHVDEGVHAVPNIQWLDANFLRLIHRGPSPPPNAPNGTPWFDTGDDSLEERLAAIEQRLEALESA
jgi:hypothetical protein